MPTIHFAKRSIAAACLASWTTATVMRPKFAGQNQVVELSVTQVDPTWSPQPYTLDSTYSNDIPVMVRPAAVQIARKQYLQLTTKPILLEELVDGTEFQSDPVEVATSPATRRDVHRPVVPPTSQAVPMPRQSLPPRELPQTVSRVPQSAGTDRMAPSFTNSPPPTYPSIAIQNRWEGTVLLRVYIDVDGAVENVEVARTSGHAVLDGAAVNAVRRWRGNPAMLGGQAIATIELLPVRFKLRD